MKSHFAFLILMNLEFGLYKPQKTGVEPPDESLDDIFIPD